MKKIFGIILVTVLAVSACFACSKNTETTDNRSSVEGLEKKDAAESESPAEQQQLTAAATETPAETPSATPEPTLSPAETLADDSRAAYEKFLKGELKASFEGVSDRLVPDSGEASLQDMLNHMALVLGRDSGLPNALAEASYAYIDCGLDGVPELALYLYFEDALYEYASPLTEYVVFKYIDGKVCFLTSAESYYRYDASINSAGVISDGGSSGASTASFSRSFIDAEGNVLLVYTDDLVMCLADLKIPTSYLSASNKDIGVSDNWGEDEYSLDIYNFLSFDYSQDNWQEKYDEYADRNLYIFYDRYGEPVLPDEETLKLYKDRNITVLDGKELEDALNAHYSDIGYTMEMENADSPEWISLELEDMASVKAQIELFTMSQDIWRIDDNDVPSNCVVYYAITDLNMNGRLEITRYAKHWDIGFCQNRFFEISEDFTSVGKMEYQLEDYWANGEETGYAPDFDIAEYPIYCYWSTDSENYYYILDDIRSSDDGEDRTVIALIARPDGYMSTYWLGESCYDDGAGERVYINDSGYGCSEEEFIHAAENAFPSESGWRRDQVGMGFTMILNGTEDDAIEQALLDSYKQYYHSTEWNY